MAKVKFLRGSKENYDVKVYQDYVYFALDTHEIILNGVSYSSASSGNTSNENSLNAIISVEKGPQTGDLIFIYRDGTKTSFSIPLASDVENGLMSKEDKIKLDDVYERLSWIDLDITD